MYPMGTLIFKKNYFFLKKMISCDSSKWNFESLLSFSQVEVGVGIFYYVF